MDQRLRRWEYSNESGAEANVIAEIGRYCSLNKNAKGERVVTQTYNLNLGRNMSPVSHFYGHQCDILQKECHQQLLCGLRNFGILACQVY